IRQLSDRIAERFRPDRIILFGSYAYGTPRKDSDVDLLVVMPFEGNGLRQAAEMIRQVDPPFAVDLLVRTSAELKQRLEWNDFFLREIVDKGKLLYVAADR